jgi:hypothetical protein
VARAQVTEAAQVTGLTLSWVAPVECPGGDDVRARVDALLGRSASGVAALDARALVTRTEGGYSLSLETVQGAHRGTRAMSDASCVELARAAAAVIALAIDPSLTLAVPGEEIPAAEFPPPAAPRVARPPPSAAFVEPEAPAPVRAPRPRAVAPEGWVGLSGGAALGTLPGMAPGFGLALSGRYDFLSLEVLAWRLPTRHVEVPDAPGVGADVDYLGVETRVCASKSVRRLSPGVCAGFGAGRLRAASRGASTPGSGSVTWVTPRLGGLLRYALAPRFAVHAGAQVLLPVTRVEFTLENLAGAVYEPAPVGLLLDAGVAVRFW